MKKPVLFLAFAFLAVFSAGAEEDPYVVGGEFFDGLFSSVPSSVAGSSYTDFDCMRGVHTPPIWGVKRGMYPESNSLPEQPYPVCSAAGLVDFTAGYSSESLGNSAPKIHGWSRNGHIFCSFFNNVYRRFMIINLVTDDVVWEGFDYVFEDDAALISEIVSRYGIEPDVGETGGFPFSLNGDVYEVFCTGENRDNQYHITIDISAKRNGGAKKIGSVTGSRLSFFDYGSFTQYVSSQDWPEKNLRFMYVKSPFENRIAVIVFIPRTHSEFDYPYYDISVLGCDLETGF